jgi:hypothetical protein
MSVSETYLSKIKFAVRTVSEDAKVLAELTDIIEECRADMVNKGVEEYVAYDETDPCVLGCVRSFTRWKFSIDSNDIKANKQDYRLQVDELRKAARYEDT